MARLLLTAILCTFALGCTKRSGGPAASVAPPDAVSLVTVPTGYNGQAELPVVVALHGMGGAPHKFWLSELQPLADRLKGSVFQQLADSSQVVVLFPSGPISDRSGYTWSDDIEENFARIIQALDDKHVPAKMRKKDVILVGYSQGAYAALGLAYEHPETFAGVIALAPGSLVKRSLGSLPSPLLAKRGFILAQGAKDDPAYLLQGIERVEAARKAGAKVDIKVYPNDEHSIPEDIEEMLPKWFEFVRNANGS